nr:putative integron gene cassette protein [uncultured bacterium]
MILYLLFMNHYKFTPYFENEVLRKRPYLKKEWCIQILKNPLRVEPQEKNRFRFWGSVVELDGRVLRVITLSDKITIHNAFPDRRFKT